MMKADVGGSGDFHEQKQQQEQHCSPFRMLGIALVVDELGKGARMVFRYPTIASASTDTDADEHVNDDNSDDVFFQLSGRQMAKLFRPKPALCGQPITLSIGGTVFCCCAVVKGDINSNAEHQKSTGEADSGGSVTESEEEEDLLVLFSVVVALVPRNRSSTIPIVGWMEPGRLPTSDDQKMAQRHHSIPTSHPLSTLRAAKVTQSFLCIQRVHVSLTRLCRVLEREERRCRYVSVHSKLVDDVRSEFRNGNGRDKYGCYQPASNCTERSRENGEDEETPPPPPPPPTTTSINPNSNQASPVSLISFKAPHIVARKTSGAFSLSYDPESTMKSTKKADEGKEDLRLLLIEQEVIETLMLIHSPGYRGIDHPGNLVRELIHVYHSLGRNDFSDTALPATSVVSIQEGLVYVNEHVAVAIEPVSSATHHVTPAVHHGQATNHCYLVRSYQTLLFPRSSPTELLDAMTFSPDETNAPQSMAPPRRMQQLLRTLSPRKTLREAATEASLPLSVALELASTLVAHKVCFVASTIISRTTRLACCTQVSVVREHALSFSQTFGTAICLFEVVSFLTAPHRTLGDAMDLLASSNDASARSIRNRLIEMGGMEKHAEDHDHDDEKDITIDEVTDDGDEDDDQVGPILQPRDPAKFVNLLYQMVVWLCSHSVLVGLQEYLVKMDSNRSLSSSTDLGARGDDDNDNDPERKHDSIASLGTLSDTKLLAELQDTGCLTGTVSIQACCWKLGIDRAILVSRVVQLRSVRIVRRIPMPGDDWNGIFSTEGKTSMALSSR